MNSLDILREVTSYVKYSKYLDKELHKETFDQVIERTVRFFNERLDSLVNYSKLSNFELKRFEEMRDMSFRYLRELRVLPAMRVIQFAGEPIIKQPQRVFNCSYTAVDSIEKIADIFYMLLCGVGVGYSVCKDHIRHLPTVVDFLRKKTEVFVIPDSIEGWREAVLKLLRSFFSSTSPFFLFDYNNIRKKGELILSTGSLSPGPEPLKEAFKKILAILTKKKPGDRLNSLEISDIICILADCVVSGGSRRSALIALFDEDDNDMITCKHGNWYEKHAYRSRANFSALVYKGKLNKNLLSDVIWNGIESGFGEPGIIVTFCEDKSMGVNPCAEIGLRSGGTCNLTEINASAVKSTEEFYRACVAAAFFGTIQATFTNFTAVLPEWSNTCREDALLGVGITGILSSGFFVKRYMNCSNGLKNILRRGVQYVIETNVFLSKIFGINVAKRMTCIKPAGTTSCILGCSSGIHPVFAPYYYRRIRVVSDMGIVKAFEKYAPELIEDDKFSANTKVISIPIHFKGNCIYNKNFDFRKQFAIANFFQENWVLPGSLIGKDPHNVSTTVYYKNVENEEFFEEMYWYLKNTTLRAISFLPVSEHKYEQAPFEEISGEEYERASLIISKITQLDYEDSKYIPLDYGQACTSDKCELNQNS